MFGCLLLHFGKFALRFALGLFLIHTHKHYTNRCTMASPVLSRLAMYGVNSPFLSALATLSRLPNSSLSESVVMIAKFRSLSAFLLLWSAWASAQQTPVPSVTPQGGVAKSLAIPDIFAEGGLTGRAPETVKWSPDGKRVSYVLRESTVSFGISIWRLQSRLFSSQAKSWPH